MNVYLRCNNSFTLCQCLKVFENNRKSKKLKLIELVQKRKIKTHFRCRNSIYKKEFS